MKKWGFIILLLTASCYPGSDRKDMAADESDKEKEVRALFNDWIAAVVKKDFDKYFDFLHPRMVTLYFWSMYQQSNRPDIDDKRREILRRRYLAVPKDSIGALEEWIKRNPIRLEEHVALLPFGLLRSDWIKETVRADFELTKKDLSYEFDSLRVMRVYADNTGATVLAENLLVSRKHFFDLRPSADGWKLFGHRKSTSRGN